MTNEEAIAQLEVTRECMRVKCANEIVEALDMAIKALGSWDKYSSKLWKKAYDRGFKDGVRDGIQAME